MAYSYPSAVKKPTPMPGTFGQTPQAIPNASPGSIPKPMFGNIAGGGSYRTPQAYTPSQTLGSIPQMYGGSPGFVGSTALNSAGMSASQAGYSPNAQGSIPASIARASKTVDPKYNYRGSIPNAASPLNGSIPPAAQTRDKVTGLPAAPGKVSYGTPSIDRTQLNSSIPPAPGTPESAAAWINKTVPGGLDAYAKNNIDRWNKGEIGYDVLLADSQRAGYQIPADNTTMDATADPAPVDYEALARAEVAKELADYTNNADALKALYTNDYDRTNQMTADQRTMDRLWVDRNNSPFTGQTDAKKEGIAREWSQADEATKNNYLAQMDKVNSGVFDYNSSVEEHVKKRAYDMAQADKANARADAELTGVYNGAPTIAATHWTQTFNEDKARYGETEAYKKARDKITDAKDRRDFEYKAKQDGVDAAVSWYNAKTSRNSSNTSSARLAWDKNPDNPDNILKNNKINEGKPLDAKTSTDNYNDLLDDFSSSDLTATADRQGVTPKSIARDILRQNKDFLSDSDYKALNNYINEKL